MDDEKKNDMDPESNVPEDSNNEWDEKEQESQPSHVTPEETEVIESNETDTSFSCEKDPEALESIHKYASRIKYFLGWDSGSEESEIVKNLDELIEASENTSGSTKLDGNIDGSIKCKEMNENLPSLVEVCSDREKDEAFPSKNGKESINDQLYDLDVSNLDKNADKMQPEKTNDAPMSFSLSPHSNKNGELRDMSTPEKSNSVENIKNSEYGEDFSVIDNTELKDREEIVPRKLSRDKILPKTKEFEKDGKENFPGNSSTENISAKLVSEAEDGDINKWQSGNSSNEDFSDKSANQSDIEINDKDCLDEHITPRINPHLADIRRLSIDIVKDVIDSARSSLHEMLLNKNEQDKIENLLQNVDELSKDNFVNSKNNFLKENDVDPNQNETLTSAGIEEGECNNFTPDTVKSLDSVFYEKDTNGKDPSEYKENIFVTKEPLKDIESLIDPDTVCGFGCFKPKCIQKWATPRTFLFFFALLGIIHGTYYSYFVGMITTLEKRYAFPSKISGTLLLADEITPLLFGILVGYIGGRTHRPRMTALGMLMAVACCFITAFPYFIYGSAKHLKVTSVANATNMQYCDIEQKEPTCNESDQPPTVSVVVLLIIASLLKGLATLSYYIMGLSYMDDNTAKKSTPLYLAISLTLRLLGPLLGYVMSFVFLKVYENPFEDPGFGPEDPRWIGAWWLGFCVQGVLLFICTIPIALFPRRMPGQRKQTQIKEETLKEMLSGLGTAMTRLAKNPVFIFLTINTVVTIFGHFGHAIMLPKYMENQFRLSASDASLLSGVTSVGCMMFSTVLGGFLIWKFKPTAKMLLGGMVASEIMLAIGFLLLTIPRCQEVEMSHYGMNNEGFILDSVCNVNCNCSTTSFTPFCGPDGKTSYFSPCYAGCTELDTSMLSKHKVFGNCSCVADALGNTGGQITEGFCPDENCWNQAIAYISILLIVIIVGKTLTVAHTIILLRSVHPNDKSFALGTFEAFICLLGFIPGPVTFGALVDSACLVWEKSCDQTGNCWFYDMEKYNYLLHIVSAIFSGFSVICLIILYFLNSRIRSLYEDEEDEKEYEDIKLDTVSGSVTKL